MSAIMAPSAVGADRVRRSSAKRCFAGQQLKILRPSTTRDGPRVACWASRTPSGFQTEVGSASFESDHSWQPAATQIRRHCHGK